MGRKVMSVFIKTRINGTPYFTVLCHRKTKEGKLVSSFGEHLDYPQIEEELVEAVTMAVRKVRR